MKKLPCGYCERIFEKEHEMISHIQEIHKHILEEEHRRRLVNDEIRRLKMQEIYRLYNLADSPGIIEVFECHPCEIEFKDELSLTCHIDEAHNITSQLPPSVQSPSQTTSNSPSRLKESQNVHEIEGSRPRPHRCPSCDKSFFTSSDLWSHQRIHSGSKYTCDICGKKLASSGSLHNHQKSVHEPKKKFECTVCLKRFALKQKLENHIKSEHEGQKPFHCQSCDQGFVHKQSFEAHQRKHDGIVLNCKLCSKPFHDAGYLKKHMRWHEKIKKLRNE